MIRNTVIRCGDEEEALVLEVLRSGRVASGSMVERFEDCCREMTGARNAVAVNYRLTELAAAVAIPQFARLHAIVAARQANAAFYSEHLSGLEGVITPVVLPGRGHAWHQYTVRITPDAKLDRDGVVAALGRSGIGAGVYYPRVVYDYDCFRLHPRVRIDGGHAVAERVAGEVVSVPVHQHLSQAELEQVVAATRMLLA